MSLYKNFEKIIIGQLNINFLQNKFDLLTYQNKSNIDILMITETKLDESFAIGQFSIMALVVLSVLIVIEMVMVFCYTLVKYTIEINLYKERCVISCSYNPNKALIANHKAVMTITTILTFSIRLLHGKRSM